MEEFSDREYEETAKKSPPNWREAFEQVLAKGGESAGNYGDCRFCQTFEGGYCGPENCKCCPIFAVDGGGYGGSCCNVFGDDFMDNSERRAICRHVLATVKDFTNVTKIRERIAEMLDDPEKFLGKAELEKVDYIHFNAGGGMIYAPRCTVDEYTPLLRYQIQIRTAGKFDDTIIAFRDEKTRDLVLEFLNA